MAGWTDPERDHKPEPALCEQERSHPHPWEDLQCAPHMLQLRSNLLRGRGSRRGRNCQHQGCRAAAGL
eukprot:10548662-Prorocentrum_lima.AAC.1